jgi:hypothetical protein
VYFAVEVKNFHCGSELGLPMSATTKFSAALAAVCFFAMIRPFAENKKSAETTHPCKG